MKEDGNPISIEKTVSNPISLDDIILIFINDVLQKPGRAYKFDGGTQIKFTEPPAAGSSLQVLFYRGTDADIGTASAVESILKGDEITINTPPSNRNILTQDTRLIREIVSEIPYRQPYTRVKESLKQKHHSDLFTWKNKQMIKLLMV